MTRPTKGPLSVSSKRGGGYGGSEPIEESGASTHPEDRVGNMGERDTDRQRVRDMGERERH